LEMVSLNPGPWRVLFLDHDDTAVASTASIHHPAHCETVRVLRPDLTPVSIDEWFELNHNPGIGEYLKSLFSPEQQKEEHRIWLQRMEEAGCPPFYDGFLDILERFQAAGGKLVVVSHSPSAVIEGHYATTRVKPDLVYGWDQDEAKRKPAPFPVHDALAKLGYSKEQAVMLDDLSPGIKMAKAAGIPSIHAAWAYSVPSIDAYMKVETEAQCATVEAFAALIEPAIVSLKGEAAKI